MNRRQFLHTAVAGSAAASLLSPGRAAQPAATSAGALAISLTDATNIRLEGPHRFRAVRGRTGLHVASVHTKAVVATEVHHAPRGTLSFWVSPLEDLTQYVAKNAVGFKFALRCVPRLGLNRSCRLRLVEAGRRLHGSFDGQTVFDVKDDPWTNNGRVYDFGRLGLRHMYNTALRYREAAEESQA